MTEQTGNNKPNGAEGLAFPLSANEKLIEEAAKAMADGEHNVLGWRGHSEDEREWYRKDAAIALAVFENALTPTDDERAIFDAIADRLGEHSQATNYEIADSGEYETKLRGPVDVEVLAEWLLPTVLGFRRSEVPEPSTECPQPCVHLSQHDAREGRTCAEHPCTCPEPQGEPSNRVIVMCARCGLFPVVGGDEINSDIVVCDRCAFTEGRESAQGEPSDAQVNAALRAYWGGVENARSHGSAYGMRAALRAAGGVR